MSETLKACGTKVTCECLGLRMRIAHRVITKVYDDALRPFGIRSSQAAMLAFAAERGTLSQAELCGELQIDDSTLSRNLDRMRLKGWITEVDGEDSRSRPYRMTSKGAALFRKIMPAWQEAQNEATRLLGAGGAQAMRRFADAQKSAK